MDNQELPCLPGWGTKRKLGFGNPENRETRQVKAGRDIDLDRLSDLPDGVICHIISLLPIKETVRTSILSTRWRDLCASISTLNIDDNNETRKSLCNSFMNIVDRVIFSRKSDIEVDKFHLKCGQAVDSFRINGWIQYALWHGVRVLDLWIAKKGFKELPYGVFTCKTLEKLRLELDFILKVPTNCCLPSLKILHLGWFKFSDDDSAQRLFSSCFLLEELVVQDCELQNINKFSVCNPTLKRLIISSYIGAVSNNYEVVINTPSLVYFKYFHFVAKGLSLINLNSLVEACIDFGPDIDSSFHYTTAVDLMRGINHVQSLHFTGHFSKVLLLCRDPIPEFPNMTYLKMGSFYPGWERILACSPFLETLVFDFKLWSQELELSINRIMDLTEKVPYCFLYHLKAIKFLSFRGKQEELQVVEHLLKNAKVLENLTIHINATKRQQLKISKELLALPRVSKKCQVVII